MLHEQRSGIDAHRGFKTIVGEIAIRANLKLFCKV
jgi:hypothetical protein